MHFSEWVGAWSHVPPSFRQFEEFLAFLVVAAGLSLIGTAIRRFSGPDDASLPEADLLVGWGAAVSVFVVAGSLTTLPFTVIACAVAGVGLLSAVMLYRDGRSVVSPGALKILALLAPIFVLIMAQTSSENDDFAQWLPNLRYLLIVDHFPGPGMPVSDSIFPSYPYADALIGYLVGKITGTVPETAVDHFNLLMLGMFALTLVRLFVGDARTGRLDWSAAGLAVAAATVLCPAFVPRLVLSNYADCATALSLAYAVILMLRLVETEAPPGRPLLIQTIVAVTLLVLIKQANLVLLALALGGIGLAVITRPRALLRLIPVIGCAALFYLAWRHQVGKIGGGEMPIAAFDQWQWSSLPETFSHMATVVANKGGYFALAFALTVAALIKVREQKLALVFTALFWGFTAFLTWVYLAVYLGYEGRSAASFWRYHTELGLLQMAALASVAGHWWHQSKRSPLQSALSRIKAGGVILVVAGPILALPYLRFDINPAKDQVRESVHAMTPLIPADAKLLVADPRGSGFFTVFVRWNLGFQAPVVGGLSVFNGDADAKRQLSNPSLTHIYVITTSPTLEQALGAQPPAAGSSLFTKAPDGRWTQIGYWPFKGFASIESFKY